MIFIALFGSIVFSYCLGNIISLISQVLVAEALPGSSRAVKVGARPGLALGPRPSGGTRWVAGWGGDDSRTQTDSETGDLVRAGVRAVAMVRAAVVIRAFSNINFRGC